MLGLCDVGRGDDWTRSDSNCMVRTNARAVVCVNFQPTLPFADNLCCALFAE